MTHLVPTPESRSARLAVQDLASCIASSRVQMVANPLYVHGGTGVGKTLLVSGLVDEVLAAAPRLVVSILQAEEFEVLLGRAEATAEVAERLEEIRQCDLWIVEDLQDLCPQNDARRRMLVEAFVQLFDYRHTRGKATVFTASVGPGELPGLPSRLVSRLGCGLVVGLSPLQESSRFQVLTEKAQQRQLAVSRDVLGWLAKHLVGGGRQLEGALAQLEILTRLHRGPLDVRSIAAHFREQDEAGRPTVERIARRVGSYFRFEPKHLRSRRRHQNVVMPRQVSMYLTRKLTGLSLQRIGEYFGGRDHSTVLHACQKIEDALVTDRALASSVQQLQADLV